MPLFEVNELGLKARLSDLRWHSFKHTISYLISFPLEAVLQCHSEALAEESLFSKLLIL